MAHRHRPAKTETRGYVAPVTDDTAGYYRQDHRAHGGITDIDTCRCGAVRKTNRNLIYVERGRWVEPTD